MRLAFIHLMRTGGSAAVAQIGAAVHLHCPWAAGLNRDWTRADLFSLAREADGLVHSHAVAWDAETHAWYQAQGWTTFTIVREPLEQLVSLWQFCGSPEPPDDLDNFLLDQLDGRQNCNLDFHHWALPDWWHEIDVIVPFEHPIGAALVRKLGLPRSGVTNQKSEVRSQRPAPSARCRHRCAASVYARRYQAALFRPLTSDLRPLTSEPT